MKKFVTLALSLSLISSPMYAIPTETVIVGDAQGIVHHSQVISQFASAYKKYEQMLSAANDQINKLNKINEVTSKANDLINNGNLNIANPLDVVENLKNTLESIKSNVDNLAQNAKDWELSNAIRFKQLRAKCSFLNLDEFISPTQTKFDTTQIGEETTFQADAKLLLETFTDIKANDLESITSNLKGLPLALVMCDNLNKYQEQLQNAQYHSAMQKALLMGDFEEYKKQKQEQIKFIVQNEIAEQEQMQKKLTPIKVRMEQMRNVLGVKDTKLAEKDGIKFCEKTNSNGKEECAPIQLTLDYVKYKENVMLQKAAQKSNQNTSQSQADREFIMIDYLREIATHLSFLNETVAMSAALMAEQQEKAMGIDKGITMDEQTLTMRKAEFKQQLDTQQNAVQINTTNAKLDKFGFPTF